MKRVYLIGLIVAFGGIIFAQEKEKTGEINFKNEIGIDATGFILLFLNLKSEVLPYYPTYYITYRRKFQSGNLRFAIGGGFDDYNVAPVFTEDKNNYRNKSSALYTRIGWEFKNELSKKWQVFYGLDFRHGFQVTNDDVIFWNGGYANGVNSKIENYGLAPLLGFRYRINERLSLSTEASFSINLQKRNTTHNYIPVTSDYPALPSEVDPTVKSVFSSFSQPFMIFVTFDI